MNAMTFSTKTADLHRWIYAIFGCVFCGLYFLRDLVGINISYYVIYAVAAIILLTVSKNEAIAFFISISAFTGAGFDGIFCLLLFGCILFRFYSNLGTVKVGSLLLLIMCIYEVIHFLIAEKTTSGTVISYVLVLFSLIIIQQYPGKEVDKTLVINSFIAFSLFFVLMTLFQMLNVVGSLDELIKSGYRIEGYTEMRAGESLSANQNYITQLSSLNICLCVMMIAKKMPKAFYIVAGVLFLISALLTVSKMFIAVIVAFVLYMAIVTMKKGIGKGVAIIVLMAAIGWLLLRLIGDSLIALVMERFENEELTTGRITGIEAMLVYMESHPGVYWFGVGILQLQYFMPKAVHSSFFEVLGGWGIPGLFLAISYVVWLANMARKDALEDGYKPDGYNYLPLFLLLGYTLVGMLFSLPFTIAQMMVCIYAIGVKRRDPNAV